MRTLLLSLSIALSLTGCAKLQQAYEVVTTSNIPPKAIYVAINSFNAAEITATNWIRYCTPNPAPVGCNDAAIKTKLIPAINKGKTAKKTLSTFLREHPDALGPAGTYQLLVTSTDIITQVSGK